MSQETVAEPEKASPQKVSNIAYGVELLAPCKLPEWLIEMYFFKNAPALISGELKPGKGAYSGEGRSWHAKKLCFLLLRGHFDLHDWSEDQMQMFSDYKWSTVAGPAAGGKTTAAAIYALFFWLSSPMDSAVIITSTTLPGLKRRVWTEISRFWRILCKLSDTAKIVDSKTCIQAQHGDDKHGIFGIAVAGGQTEKALGRIIGFHPRNLLVIVDEMTDTPEAIVDACSNLSKVEGEFQFIGVGNPKSRLDPHGKMSEPKQGWESVSVSTDFWETKHGACLHLDGLKSPAVKHKNKYRYLIKQRDIDDDIKKYGENSPKFWRFTRGFWPPDDVEQKVITESMFRQFPRCKQEAQWRRGYRNVAALDPAIGGDRCMLRFARYGMGVEGKILIEFTEIVPLKLDAAATEPMHFQIARLTREACKQRGVEPECLGVDTTGLGSGTADILQREWSTRIQRVLFGGRPTERIVSETNPNKCSQEYYNFVTELWFGFRRFLESDQIRGITDDDIFEFSSRPYEMKGQLYQVLPKPEMKAIIGRSPDLADADSIVLEVIRRHGINPATSDAPTFAANDKAIEKLNKSMDFDAHPEAYAAVQEIGGYSDGLY
jgi:hypothetical protein